MALRLTSRERQSGVCWQKILRDQFATEGIPPVPHLDVGKSVVRPISRAMAEQVILKYEWLGTMGAGTQRCYGLFFGNYCAGVTSFASSGAVPAMPKMFRVASSELSYLARGACVSWAPKGANSRLIAISCRLEAQAGIKLVIAFSDSDAGEIGTVYQAANWNYIGKSDKAWPQWVSPLGKIWSSNSLTKRRSQHGGTVKAIEARLVRDGWTKQYSNIKHRYVYLIDKRDQILSCRIRQLSMPYPKRTTRTKEQDAVHPTALGGETPTRALHIKETA